MSDQTLGSYQGAGQIHARSGWDGNTQRYLSLLAAVFATILVTAWGGIELTKNVGRIAAIWPANAITVAVLLRYCDKPDFRIILAAFAGNALADLLQQDTFGRALALSSFNAIEVLVCFGIVRQSVGVDWSIRRLSSLFIFIGAAALASFVSSVLAAVFMAQFHDEPFFGTLVIWSAADFLGLITITPLLLGFDLGELRVGLRHLSIRQTSLLYVFFTVALGLAFFQSSYPLLFLIYPTLVVIAYMAGFSIASLAVFIAAVTAIYAAISGTGPISLVDGTLAEKVIVLQCFVAVAVITGLTAAAVMNDERRLREALVRARTDAEEMRLQAETSNRAKSDFLASMSHELRTPLNAIFGFSQLLQKSRDDFTERQMLYIDSIISASEHLTRLITDILDLSRIEAGQISVVLEPVSVKPMLEEAERLLRPMADARQVELDFSVDEEDLAYVWADAGRLLQVLLNLGSNAIKYNRPGGRVTVGMRQCDGMVEFSVADNGIGIPKDRQGELFEPFNRLGAERGTIEGSGVGLTITRRLVDAMNGKINFESEPGVGSTFRFLIPEELRSSSGKGANGGNGLASDDEAQGDVVLYVEDNWNNSLVLQDALTIIEDVHVELAPNGADGVRLAKLLQPKLILLDIHLPDMTGYKVLEQLKLYPETRDIPVFALTADAVPRNRDKGIAAGFDLFITKPFKIAEMQQTVANALGRSVLN